jgi:hypothetical protein
VNPGKLPIDLQFDVCQRCHLQGNTVLKEGKSFLDFKPGMRLSDHMTLFFCHDTKAVMMNSSWPPMPTDSSKVNVSSNLEKS